MRIVTIDELPAAAEASRALLQLAAFGSVSSRADLDTSRRRTHRLADYGGVFALEGDRVLGQIYVLRVPYTFSDGPELVAGLAAVTTRPDSRRRGIATALLREAHRREREAGLRYVTLWTNPSWGAHALYEKFGYRDVYTSPWAVRTSGRLPHMTRPGRQVRPGRRSDLEEIERFHDRALEGRLGFVRRPSGSLVAQLATGRLDPVRQLFVHPRAGRLDGYAHYDRNPQRTVCAELIAENRSVRRALADAVIRASGRAPCAFQHSVVPDGPEIFGTRAYVRSTVSWWTWMTARLGAEWTTARAVATFRTRDPRFVCFSGDRF